MAGARDPDFCHPVKKAYSSGGYFSKNEFNAISNEIMPQIDKKVLAQKGTILKLSNGDQSLPYINKSTAFAARRFCFGSRG